MDPRYTSGEVQNEVATEEKQGEKKLERGIHRYKVQRKDYEAGHNVK